MEEEDEFYQRLKQVPLPQLIKWWTGEEVPEWGGTIVRVRIAGALRSTPEGIAFLKSRTESEDQIERSHAFTSATGRETCDEEWMNKLVAYYHEADSFDAKLAEGVRQTALRCFVQAKRFPIPRNEVESIMNSATASGESRRAAFLYLTSSFPDEAPFLLRAGLASESREIQATAITEAGFLGFVELEDEIRGMPDGDDWFIANSIQIACEMFDYHKLIREQENICTESSEK